MISRFRRRDREVVGLQRPCRDGQGRREVTDVNSGESVDLDGCTEDGPLLHDRTRMNQASGTDDTPVAHDGARFDD